MSLDGTKTIADQIKKAAPHIVIQENSQNVNDNVLINYKKPPFNDARIASRSLPMMSSGVSCRSARISMLGFVSWRHFVQMRRTSRADT